jgi:hypothetical protein
MLAAGSRASDLIYRSASMSSARDRDEASFKGVGGSNPLAPTNFSRKHWRSLIVVVG